MQALAHTYTHTHTGSGCALQFHSMDECRGATTTKVLGLFIMFFFVCALRTPLIRNGLPLHIHTHTRNILISFECVFAGLVLTHRRTHARTG